MAKKTDTEDNKKEKNKRTPIISVNVGALKDKASQAGEFMLEPSISNHSELN